MTTAVSALSLALAHRSFTKSYFGTCICAVPTIPTG